MVETRSQSVTSVATNISTTEAPLSLTELNREVTQIQTTVARLEASFDERFQLMQEKLMANLQRVLEIGLGKKIAAGLGSENPASGVLGVPSGSPIAVNNVPLGPLNAPAISTPTVALNDDVLLISNANNPIQPVNFSYKLFCPKFDGTDFRGWNLKLEQYFEAEMVPDSAKLRIVMLHLEGKALEWHQFMTKAQGGSTQMQWRDYIGMMRDRFDPAGFADPFAELVELRQTDSVDQYYEDFIHLINQVQLPDDYALSMFKNHLRLEISQFVKLLQPASLISAFHLAKHVENMFFPVHKKGSVPVTRSPPPLPLSIPARTGGNMFKTGFNMGGQSGQVSSKQSSPNGLSPNVTTPGGSGGPRRTNRSLSPAEIEERRRKGLCFWCAAKYTPGHKCARSQIFQISVEGLEADADGEVFLDCEDNGEGMLVELPKEEEHVLSLNAMWGATNVDTMKLWIHCGDQQCIALVDSGSSHNFISWTLAKKLNLGLDRKHQLKVVVADGNWMRTLGECKAVEWMVQGSWFRSDFLVLPLKNCEVVLGVQWLSQLGSIKWNFADLKMEFQHEGQARELQGVQPDSLQLIGSKACTRMLKVNHSHRTAALWMIKAPLEMKLSVEVLPTDLQELLQQFTVVFDEPHGLPPIRGHAHKIDLVDEKAVIKVKPYRHSTPQKDEIERLVGEMLNSGIIRNSGSPFSSPVVLVKKKDGSWRMCVDYRRLNQATIKDSFPMPVIEELLDELGEATYFSKLDLRSGYHQIRMQESDIHKTAFRTHEGHYEFLVMPFGLTNAPATFQGLMNKVFKGQLRKYVLVFFDDILVYSNTWESHLIHLQEVLGILKTNQLFAKKSKCCFGAKEVDYLGYVISNGTIAMDEAKIKGILDWPAPTNVKELRGFLGLSGYYRRFVKGYGCIARALTNLLKKGNWQWGAEEQLAFDSLKMAVSSAPVLALPDYTQTFVVETDASDQGVGAVLVQKGRPIAFFSKGLGMRYMGLSVYEKEMMAALMAVKKWSTYLIGRHFIIKTDHQSLKFLAENQAITPFQQKWVVKMMGYDYEVQYRKGIHNTVADVLSRKPGMVSCATMGVTSVSTDVFGRVAATWQNDDKLQKIIKELENGSNRHNKYKWDGRSLTRKDKWIDRLKAKSENR
ncbi:hypothetical protein GQ457_13G021400 [Hibiscus cannabinus]